MKADGKIYAIHLSDDEVIYVGMPWSKTLDRVNKDNPPVSRIELGEFNGPHAMLEELIVFVGTKPVFKLPYYLAAAVEYYPEEGCN